MKSIAIAMMMLAVIGCDPLKELDWDRTAKEQPLRIGNRLKVDGITYGLAVYELKAFTDSKDMWVKKNWDTTLELWTYNPNAPVNKTDLHNPINPNAPIGTVICTIHNPMHHPVLKELRDTYPDTVTWEEYPKFRYRFEIIGRIHSFQRATIRDADDTKPDISLTAVRIHVENLTHIESVNLKE